LTDLVFFVFSIGGAMSAVLVALIWVLARPHAVFPRRLLIVVIAFYTVCTIYPITFASAGPLIGRMQPLVASDVPNRRTAIVVLGSGGFSAHDWDENTRTLPDPMGANRVMEAARVYRIVNAEWVISSGGRPVTTDMTPASALTMRDMLIELGVPASKILLEDRSRNTHDEAVLVAAMLKTMPVEGVVLVTSDVHMRRSLGAFRAVGIDATPAIARRPHYATPWDLPWLPSNAGMTEATSVGHEYLGIAYYALRGWYK
jgi:uncharacterized SAM-binding protein YcdF (DUF218 family)